MRRLKADVFAPRPSAKGKRDLCARHLLGRERSPCTADSEELSREPCRCCCYLMAQSFLAEEEKKIERAAELDRGFYFALMLGLILSAQGSSAALHAIGGEDCGFACWLSYQLTHHRASQSLVSYFILNILDTLQLPSLELRLQSLQVARLILLQGLVNPLHVCLFVLWLLLYLAPGSDHCPDH